MLLVPGESYYFICTLHNFKFKIVSIAQIFGSTPEISGSMREIKSLRN